MSQDPIAEGEASRRLLRVGLVTETYPPEINGVANTMRHLVEGLERRGHRIQLVRPRQRGERPSRTDGGETQTLVPGLPIPGYRGLRFGLPAYWRLRHLWRKSPPDVLYIATQGPLGHAALAAGRAVGIPTVTGFHTRFHQYSSHYGLGPLKGPIVGALRRFHNRSDATLVPSPELLDELIALGFRDVHLLSRGVDTELFGPHRRSDELRRSWGCSPAAPVLLYVGRLAVEKNLGLALRAFRHITAEMPQARFVLVGDGPAREQLRASHPELILPGAKVGVELAEHYASGDLFLFPSRTETFGNVVLEAMASGLPVIAFDYAAAGAFVRTEDNGIKVPVPDEDAFVDAAVKAAEDGDRLGAMSERARATAECMGWDRVVGDLEHRFFDVIRLRRKPANETLAATPE
jgi:glycosyltransferase involved in cell wall biosynthesis